MDTNKESKVKVENSQQYKLKNIIDNIKSNFILKILLNHLTKIKRFKIIKYNKKTQKWLNLNIIDYKTHSELFTPIEIEIIPATNEYGYFIHKIGEMDNRYYQIYFNDNKEKISRNYITEKDKVKKIKIIIEYNITSL